MISKMQADIPGTGTTDVRAGRLKPDDYVANFSDIHTPLSHHEARVEADRCYFCHDAPCATACPTGIDIPLFIRQIATDNAKGAATTIFDENILGGMCARVCPTETLCEQACVREAAEGKPVKIGLLQRHATDPAIAAGQHPYQRAAATGRRIAVVGAGPAGLACAHRLAMLGYGVTIFEARPKPGGLNEYGIAAYKAVDGFAQAEAAFILSIGGIEIAHGKALGRDLSLADLRQSHDAVFLALGLAGVHALGTEGEDLRGVHDAVAYIAELRQAADLATLPVGRRVVVIGGGMTAIDIAVQTRLLGADEVTIVYRRGPGDMKASRYEQDLAQTRGVSIKHWARPVRLIATAGAVRAAVFEYTRLDDGRLTGTGEEFTLEADMVFKAIGQTFLAAPLAGQVDAPALENGRIRIDGERRTSVDGVWAGGDCVAGGADLTVAAAEDGKVAALSIHRALTGRA